MSVGKIYKSNGSQWNYVGDYDVRINDRQCNNNCYIPSFRGSNALIHCRTSDTSNVKVLCAHLDTICMKLKN